MRNESFRARQGTDREEPDEWLIDAARRGHKLPLVPRPTGTSAWRMLLSAGIPDEEVLRLACAASGSEPADFSRLSSAVASLLAHGVALRHRVVPLGVHDGMLQVATSNPRSAELERELAFAAKQRVRLCAASPGDIIRAQGVVYASVYGTKADTGIVAAPLAAPPAAAQPRATPPARLSLGIPIPAEAQDPPVHTYPVAAPKPAPDPTDRLFAAAFIDGVSDAILEPLPDGGLLVRLRIDGVLNDRFRIAEAHATRTIQLLKARGGVNVGETQRRQQGDTTFASPDGPVMIRISTEPLGEGRERVVLRRFSAQAPEPAAFQVLVVDDDGAARRALAHDLAEAGLLVLQAADGVAALAYVKRLHPDVVLTEAALPRLDAIGMLAALAGLESAPVVVVRTEQRNDALASWLREAGAGAVLPHALPAVELAARLKELARGA